MPRNKMNYEQFMGKHIHNPPEKFQYDDGQYIIWSESVFDEDYYIQSSNNRIFNTTDKNLINDWIGKNDLPGTWSEWGKIIRPIILFFDIPPKKRQELYQKLRESTLAKLKKSIEAIEELYNYSEMKWDSLIIERQYLDARLNGYNFLYNKLLKGKRESEHKFLYPIIKPLFEKLIEKDYSIKEQCEIINSLFEIGKFDDYVNSLEKHEDGCIDYTKGIDRIEKIRSKLKLPSPAPKKP